jgi:hypothetical protein
MGAASAWIIGQNEDLSIMSIDESHSDFIPNERMHLFIQEILPEDLPETLKTKDEGGRQKNEG